LWAQAYLRFGTLDIETYQDDNYIPKVYALGYYVKIMLPESVRFYICERMTSDGDYEPKSVVSN